MVVSFYALFFFLSFAFGGDETAKVADEVKSAFNLLEVSPPATFEVVWNRYLEKVATAKSSIVPAFAFRDVRNLNLALDWLKHHYRPQKHKKPAASLIALLTPKNPGQLAYEAAEREAVRRYGNMFLGDRPKKNPISEDMDQAFRLLRISPTTSFGEAGKSYWKIRQELSEIGDPSLQKKAEEYKARLDLAWKWVKHHHRKEEIPQNKLVVISPDAPKYTFGYWTYNRQSDYSPSGRSFLSMPNGSGTRIDLYLAFKREGVAGVLKYFGRDIKNNDKHFTNTYEALRSRQQVVEFGQAIEPFIDQWNRVATNEERILLARVLKGYLTPPLDGVWTNDVASPELRSKHLEIRDRFVDALYDSAIKNASSLEEYVEWLKEAVPPDKVPKNNLRLKDLLFEDGTTELRVHKKFGASAEELRALYGYAAINADHYGHDGAVAYELSKYSRTQITADKHPLNVQKDMDFFQSVAGPVLIGAEGSSKDCANPSVAAQLRELLSKTKQSE